ncbi:PorV/PorQ family protein [candidate division KSB1 bacterium]|nr:PorV/PorQ family protein [candidate division KSB1 bacterium]
MMKTFWLSLIIFFLGPSLTGAASKYAGEFMDIGVGARALGMGGAYTALAADITAGYWNPAGLTQFSEPQLILMHSEQFAGLETYDYAALGKGLPNGATASLSLIRLGVDDIPISTKLEDPDDPNISPTNRPILEGMTSDAEYALYFSYARSKGENLSLGGSAKLVHKRLAHHYGLGLGFDLGVMYFWHRVQLGAALRNALTTLVAWDTGQKEWIRPELRLGICYFLSLKALSAKITPTVDLSLRMDNRRNLTANYWGHLSLGQTWGLEYEAYRRVALRVGMNEVGLSAGAGIRLGSYRVDYAFVGHNDLGNSHMVSLMYAWP